MGVNMNYDKAHSLIIDAQVGTHFTNKELKTAAKVLMINSMVKEKLIVDKKTRFEQSVYQNADGYTVQSRALRGDVK